ncbi:hypothetical protein SK128_010929, partial [Halocaridina rubra]
RCPGAVPYQETSEFSESDIENDYDAEAPSTSWGLTKRKHPIGIISESDDDDDVDVVTANDKLKGGICI